MKKNLFLALIIATSTISCAKKTATVSPQITDSVTQTVQVSGASVLEEAQALKQEVKEVLQSVSDAGISVEHQELKREIEKNRASE